MADTAAHLVDDVLPRVPVRHWVLSFPHRVRYLLAYNPRLCAGVRRIFVSVVLGWHQEQALREGIPGARSGAVVFTQRFGSALNSNLHFHALVTDGVFTSPSPSARAYFHPAEPLQEVSPGTRCASAADPRLPVAALEGDPPRERLGATAAEYVEELTCRLHRRITRYLQRTGHLPRDLHDDEAPQDEPDEPLLAQLGAASVQGRVALGQASGRPITRLGRRREIQPLSIPDELCCDVDGFSLHAKILVEAHERERLEHLCRYVARPPLSTERLSLAPDGKVIYRLRRHWRDGTAAIAFDPLTFIERLAALVPRPRCHQLTYHGVLAPAAQIRDLVVPKGRAATPGTTPHPSIQRLPWAELLKRVFAALTCPWCGGSRKLIALLSDGLVVRQILAHLNLPTEPPPLAPARAPPEPAFDW